jgi:hypothetical protein
MGWCVIMTCVMTVTVTYHKLMMYPRTNAVLFAGGVSYRGHW